MFQDITRNTPYDTYFNDEEEATSTVKDIIQKVKNQTKQSPITPTNNKVREKGGT